MTDTLVGGSSLAFGGVSGLGNSTLSDLQRNFGSDGGAMGGLLYSFLSALVSTWPLLP